MTFENFALEQMREKIKCFLAPSGMCIPLKGDPLCKACYEAAKKKVRPESLTPLHPPLDKGGQEGDLIPPGEVCL